MNDYEEKFQAFSDNRLIEIVRNSKQFGYDDTIRNAALEVLKERGISEQDLQLTGNLTNYRFDYVRTINNAYNINSRLAFILYSIWLILKSVTLFHLANIDKSDFFFLSVDIGLPVLYLIFLVMSFLNHINFYKSIGKELSLGDQIIFFILGMPLYIIMYFIYKNQMIEEMKSVP